MSASSTEGQDYKVELIDDLVSAAPAEHPAEDGLAVHQRALHRPLPRPPRPHHRDGRRLQAALARRRLLARGLRPHDADPHLRHRLLHEVELEEHLERLEQARPRDHRKLGRELDLFMFSELSPGQPRSGSRPGWRCGTRSPTCGAPRTARRGYCEVQHADPLRRRAVQAVGALGHLPRAHVLHRRRGPPDGAQADELPGPHPDLQGQPPLLPRPADPLLRGRAVHRHEPSGTLHGLLRVRHFTQDDAHIFCTEDQVQEEVVQCLRFGFFLYDLFGFEPRLELSTRPDETDRQRRDVGPRRGGARGSAGRRGPGVRTEPRRRRLLRAQDRPAHDRLARALVAARHGPARLLDARALRARITPAPTTRSTAR